MDSISELNNKIETFKMRILFCIHKYAEDIIHTYNYNRKPGRPKMTYEWLRGFILKELIQALKNPVIRSYKKFDELLLDQHYRTTRHVKTGENYDIYLTVAHILKSYRSDKERQEDENLVNDVLELIKDLNDNEIPY